MSLWRQPSWCSGMREWSISCRRFGPMPDVYWDSHHQDLMGGGICVSLKQCGPLSTLPEFEDSLSLLGWALAPFRWKGNSSVEKFWLNVTFLGWGSGGETNKQTKKCQLVHCGSGSQGMEVLMGQESAIVHRVGYYCWYLSTNVWSSKNLCTVRGAASQWRCWTTWGHMAQDGDRTKHLVCMCS